MKLLTFAVALLGTNTIAFGFNVPRVESSAVECDNGKTKCAIGELTYGDRILKCDNGAWKFTRTCRAQDICYNGRCTRGPPRPRDEVTTPIDANSSSKAICTEGKTKCLAAQDDGRDGGVFICRNRHWKMFQDCRSNERCIAKPKPHCVWASPRARGEPAASEFDATEGTNGDKISMSQDPERDEANAAGDLEATPQGTNLLI